MKIHEYQAKAILARHGVAVPRGRAVTTLAEVKRAAAELGGKVVVKAQIHAGGRGKGRLIGKPGQTAAMYAKLQADPSATEGAVRGPRSGGVRLAESSEKAVAEARKILGKYLVTHQTGPEGKKVQRLLIEEQSEIADEYYAAVLIDSTLGAPVLIVSPRRRPGDRGGGGPHPQGDRACARRPGPGLPTLQGPGARQAPQVAPPRHPPSRRALRRASTAPSSTATPP